MRQTAVNSGEQSNVQQEGEGSEEIEEAKHQGTNGLGRLKEHQQIGKWEQEEKPGETTGRTES
jgi:hypothetical protein